MKEIKKRKKENNKSVGLQHVDERLIYLYEMS